RRPNATGPSRRRMTPMSRGNCFNGDFPSSGVTIQRARLVGLAVGAYGMLKGIDRIRAIAFNATQPNWRAKYVSHDRCFFSFSRFRCNGFSARLVPLDLADSAGRPVEGIVG